jgi:hypothetical protein
VQFVQICVCASGWTNDHTDSWELAAANHRRADVDLLDRIFELDARAAHGLHERIEVAAQEVDLLPVLARASMFRRSRRASRPA